MGVTDSATTCTLLLCGFPIDHFSPSGLRFPLQVACCAVKLILIFGEVKYAVEISWKNDWDRYFRETWDQVNPLVSIFWKRLFVVFGNDKRLGDRNRWIHRFVLSHQEQSITSHVIKDCKTEACLDPSAIPSITHPYLASWYLSWRKQIIGDVQMRYNVISIAVRGCIIQIYNA